MSPAETFSMAAVQAFLDEVTALKINTTHYDWYQVDVAAVLDGCHVEGHEVDPVSGDALLFLKSSLMFCSPETGAMRHYPRSLVHCFVDDRRKRPDVDDPELLYRGELFSVTPESEQLCWVRDCVTDHEIPIVQSAVSTWMRWLNKP
jgi:hypothetical protein